MSEQDERDFIESIFLGIAKQIHTIGLPKAPLILNSFSPDSHSVYVCIWPATSADGEWKTKALRFPAKKFDTTEPISKQEEGKVDRKDLD